MQSALNEAAVRAYSYIFSPLMLYISLLHLFTCHQILISVRRTLQMG